MENPVFSGRGIKLERYIDWRFWALMVPHWIVSYGKPLGEFVYHGYVYHLSGNFTLIESKNYFSS